MFRVINENVRDGGISGQQSIHFHAACFVGIGKLGADLIGDFIGLLVHVLLRDRQVCEKVPLKGSLNLPVALNGTQVNDAKHNQRSRWQHYCQLECEDSPCPLLFWPFHWRPKHSSTPPAMCQLPVKRSKKL